MEGDFKIRCPKCNGTQTRFLRKIQKHHCYSCDNDWEKEEEVRDE